MTEKKLRIVERTYPNGDTQFVIQFYRKGLIFEGWFDCSLEECGHDDTVGLIPAAYKTLEQAEKNLYRFDGTKTIDKVVKEY